MGDPPRPQPRRLPASSRARAASKDSAAFCVVNPPVRWRRLGALGWAPALFAKRFLLAIQVIGRVVARSFALGAAADIHVGQLAGDAGGGEGVLSDPDPGSSFLRRQQSVDLFGQCLCPLKFIDLRASRTSILA